MQSTNTDEKGKDILLKDFFTNDEDNVSVINTNIYSAVETGCCVQESKNDCKEKLSLKNSCVNSFPLAMAYVPMQRYEKLYCAEDALKNGTLFEDLNLPFYGSVSYTHLGGCRI